MAAELAESIRDTRGWRTFEIMRQVVANWPSKLHLCVPQKDKDRLELASETNNWFFFIEHVRRGVGVRLWSENYAGTSFADVEAYVTCKRSSNTSKFKTFLTTVDGIIQTGKQNINANKDTILNAITTIIGMLKEMDQDDLKYDTFSNLNTVKFITQCITPADTKASFADYCVGRGQ